MDIKIKKLKNNNDLIKWVSWLNDTVVTKFSEQRFYKHNLKTQKKFVKNKLLEKKSRCFKIYYKNEFVGVLELGNIDFNHKNCEIMYLVGEKKLWGKGIATKAINLGIEFAFKNMKMKNIYAGTYSSNFASQKALRKNKFKIVGKLSNFFKPLESKLKRESKIIFLLSSKIK